MPLGVYNASASVTPSAMEIQRRQTLYTRMMVPLVKEVSRQLPFPEQIAQPPSVDIYVVDTGVRITHVEFGGRATFAKSFGSGVPGQDINGHGQCPRYVVLPSLKLFIGTHCAGIAASSLHGVAKEANIIAVKVMGDDGTGSASDIISGISFVVQSVAASNRPSAINLSVTTPGSNAVDDAVSNAVSFGVHVIVAAGNENTDASVDSPARASTVIAVGATDINDKRASFSNFGPDVDIWAPGVGIISLGITSDTAVRTLDGTSMATPFVTGLVAYFLTLEGTMSPLQMKQQLRSVTTNGAISGLSKRHLLDKDYIDAYFSEQLDQCACIQW
jgi:cerevisin